MSKEVIQQALEALKSCDSNMDGIDQRFDVEKVALAIAAIEAMPAQQPDLMIENWIKPHPKCDAACLYKCTKGFQVFPECAAAPQPAQQETINGRTVAVDWKAQALELREIVRLGGIKIAELEAALAQQKAVAWMHEWEDGEKIPMLKGRDDRNQDKPKTVRPLVYGDTSPQPAQRTWVGLTEEERMECFNSDAWGDLMQYAEAIEAKLKEKNT